MGFSGLEVCELALDGIPLGLGFVMLISLWKFHISLCLYIDIHDIVCMSILAAGNSYVCMCTEYRM